MYFIVVFVYWFGYNIKINWIDGNGLNMFVCFFDDEKYIYVYLKNINFRFNILKYYRNVMINVIVMLFNDVEIVF